MKKFNIICALVILVMALAIAFQIYALYVGTYFTYHLVMLIINSVLLGQAIGQCYLANVLIKNRCNFDREEEQK